MLNYKYLIHNYNYITDAIIVVDTSTKSLFILKNQWYKINNLQWYNSKHSGRCKGILHFLHFKPTLFLYVFYFFEKTLQSFDVVNAFGKYFMWSLSGASPPSL